MSVCVCDVCVMCACVMCVWCDVCVVWVCGVCVWCVWSSALFRNVDLTKSKLVFLWSAKWQLLCWNNALKCAGLDFPAINCVSFVTLRTAVAKLFFYNMLAEMTDGCTLYWWWQGQVFWELCSLGYYAASSNFSPTFQDNLPEPSSGLRNPKGLDSWTLKKGLIGCPETSVRN